MKQILSKFLPIEWVTLFYAILTAILIILLNKNTANAQQLLLQRFEIISVVLLFNYLDHKWQQKITRILRTIFPLTLLAFWYPDTFNFCHHFKNLDYLFAHADYTLFGCQPSISFDQIVPKHIFSELFHLGYFSYYPMIATTCMLAFILPKKQGNGRIATFEAVSFVVMAGFYLYYIIYLFLPVAGPQYYFPVIGYDKAESGIFPQLGYYFATHTSLIKPHTVSGFFESLVETMQAAGEKPTAAFPSSHVGMSTIMIILLFKQKRYAGLLFLPFYVVLCASTIYIQAHYFVDVLGGWITGILFFWLSVYLYQLMGNNSEILNRKIGFMFLKRKN